MRQQERIARILAKKKALDQFKRWRADEINRYVDIHYSEYLRFADIALSTSNRTTSPVENSPLAIFITRTIQAGIGLMRQLFR
jgi:hypothetical protein